MIGLLYSGSYPGGAVWKVDKEGVQYSRIDANG